MDGEPLISPDSQVPLASGITVIYSFHTLKRCHWRRRIVGRTQGSGLALFARKLRKHGAFRSRLKAASGCLAPVPRGTTGRYSSTMGECQGGAAWPSLIPACGQ